MGMIGNVVRVPVEVRKRIDKRPGLITELLYGPDEDSASSQEGFFSRLFGKKEKQSEEVKLDYNLNEETDAIDLDKAWHAIHYLLTGSNWEGNFPEGFLVSCGRVVGDIEVGYGPARSFSSQEVVEINDCLHEISSEDLKGKFDREEMYELEIYPEIWDEEESWDYVLGCYEELKVFINQTANQNQSIFVYIN